MNATPAHIAALSYLTGASGRMPSVTRASVEHLEGLTITMMDTYTHHPELFEICIRATPTRAINRAQCMRFLGTHTIVCVEELGMYRAFTAGEYANFLAQLQARNLTPTLYQIVRAGVRQPLVILVDTIDADSMREYITTSTARDCEIRPYGTGLEITMGMVSEYKKGTPVVKALVDYVSRFDRDLAGRIFRPERVKMRGGAMLITVNITPLARVVIDVTDDSASDDSVSDDSASDDSVDESVSATY